MHRGNARSLPLLREIVCENCRTGTSGGSRLHRPRLGADAERAFSLLELMPTASIATQVAAPINSKFRLRVSLRDSAQSTCRGEPYASSPPKGSHSERSGTQVGSNSVRRTGAAISSYSSLASIAGPRRAPSVRTRTVRQKAPCGTPIVSPIRIKWFGLLTVRWFTVTAPVAHRRAPSERLLTKRANHNHWSNRRLFGAGKEGSPFKRASTFVA